MECTLRGIFQEHFEAYAARRRLPLYVHRAAYWISRCRTAELGGHVRRCPAGHVERAFYNSCLFLDRYLAHVAPPRLQCVRGYGLYGARQRAGLDAARAALGQAPVEQPEPLSAPRFLARFAQTTQGSRCPRCAALLVFA